MTNTKVGVTFPETSLIHLDKQRTMISVRELCQVITRGPVIARQAYRTQRVKKKRQESITGLSASAIIMGINKYARVVEESKVER